MGTIGKVAKLRFPNDQGVGVVGGVAVLEGQHRFFRQDGINHGEGRLVVRRVLQRDVSSGVPLLAVLIMNHRVAVGEGTASGVFARQTHWKATGHQRRKRHVLAHAPVHRQVASAHGSAVVIHFFHQRMRSDVGRQGGDPFGQALPLGHGDGRVSGIGPFFAQKRRPIDGELGFEIGQHRV